MPYQNPYALGLLMSDGTVVDFATALAPVANQVLTASSPTAASWGTPSGGANAAILNASATDAPTTTSATDIALTSMLITPGAGNYMLWYSCMFQNSNASSSNAYSVYVNGVQVAVTSRVVRVPAAGATSSMMISTYLTGVLAGQAVEIRWHVTGGTGTTNNR